MLLDNTIQTKATILQLPLSEKTCKTILRQMWHDIIITALTIFYGFCSISFAQFPGAKISIWQLEDAASMYNMSL